MAKLKIAGWVVLLCVVGWRLGPSGAQAQAGAYVTPMFTTAEVFDDNVFSAPSNPPAPATGTTSVGREDDFITRFSPGLGAGYKSEPFTLVADYRLDADVYARHSSLTSFPARQLATTTLTYLPIRRLTLGLRGLYRGTDTARDLNLFQLIDPHGGTSLFTATNLDTRRVAAHEYSGSPSVAYQLSHVLDASASYAFQRTDQRGATNDSQIANTALSWKLDANQTLRVGYAWNRFTFGNQGQAAANQDLTTHTVLLGWAYRVTELLDVLLQAGPRFSDGSVDADAAATATYHVEDGSISLAYFRRQGTTVGRVGAVTADTAATGVSYDITRHLGLGAGFTYSKNQLDMSNTDVYQTTVGLAYKITDWLSLTLSHQFWFQDEHFDDRASQAAAGRSHEEIYHNFVLVGLRASDSWRLDWP